jgi:hypothetical protein
MLAANAIAPTAAKNRPLKKGRRNAAWTPSRARKPAGAFVVGVDGEKMQPDRAA